MQGDAFIRAYFHIEPESLTPSQWNERYADAMFIERQRLENMAKLLTEIGKVMGGTG